MADDCDIAAENEQLHREYALLNRRSQKAVMPTGFCLWCSEPLPGDRRFCDSECRDDWQHHNRRRE